MRSTLLSYFGGYVVHCVCVSLPCRHRNDNRMFRTSCVCHVLRASCAVFLSSLYGKSNREPDILQVLPGVSFRTTTKGDGQPSVQGLDGRALGRPRSRIPHMARSLGTIVRDDEPSIVAGIHVACPGPRKAWSHATHRTRFFLASGAGAQS